MKTYKGVEIAESEWMQPEPGRYYLILWSPQQGPDMYSLSSEPGRTNMSREPRLHGWLGTTNNTARYAEGCVEVYRNQAGHLRIRPCADIVPIEMSEQ
jgi:hypothetical protein